MQQEKIGAFIAERRKAVNLTQSQLAQKLNITNRAISKWEGGRAMPDSSIMLDLCNILEISVDDLLRGKMSTANCDKKRVIYCDNPNGRRLRISFWIEKSIPTFFGFLAFLISTFTYGAGGLDHWKQTYQHRRLFHFIFGGGRLYDANEVNGSYKLTSSSAISLFGVLAFICLLIGFLFYIFYVFKNNDKLYFVSSAAIILSGIFILFILTVGTKVEASHFYSLNYSAKFENFSLGIGTIMWSLFCIMGGAFGFYQYLTTNKCTKK